MTVVLFLIILTALVFVHELGHFMAAKLFHVRVDEFAIGFPPRLFGFTKGETRYSFNLIPFGGYVKIFGENPDDDSTNGADSARSLVHAAPWKQIIILLAGITMNILFAWMLISVSFNLGFLSSVDGQSAGDAQNVSVMIMSVMPNSPSDAAGLKQGDDILAIANGSTKKSAPSISDIQTMIAQSSGMMSIEYQRGTATGSVSVTAESGIVDGKKAIGIAMGEVGTVRFGFFQSFVEGAKLTAIETQSIAAGIWSFIVGAIKGNSAALASVAGPVGIAGMVGQAEGMGLSYLLGFIAMISINLAVLNCIPFPALDGGRAFFVIFETVIRRKIKPVILNWANMIGFVILIGLMIFITYKDIAKLIK